MGRAVPRLLRERGWSVEAHDDHFPETTEDVDLLPAVAQRGWVMVTEDRRMRYRAPEREAYLKSGLRLFSLATGNLPWEAKVEVLLKASHRIQAVLSKEPGPFLFRIAKDGTLLRID